MTKDAPSAPEALLKPLEAVGEPLLFTREATHRVAGGLAVPGTTRLR